VPAGGLTGSPAGLPGMGIFYFFLFFFIFFIKKFLPQATPWSAAGPPAPSRDRPKEKINYYLFLIFFNFNFNFFGFFGPSGLALRSSAGLSHGSPPTSYLLTPTYFLYYYIRLLMSLISLFFLCSYLWEASQLFDM
jgi:hypothetical protein